MSSESPSLLGDSVIYGMLLCLRIDKSLLFIHTKKAHDLRVMSGRTHIGHLFGARPAHHRVVMKEQEAPAQAGALPLCVYRE
jgi:hypothetical protein